MHRLRPDPSAGIPRFFDLPKDSDLTVNMDPDEDDFNYDLALTKKGDAYISGDGSNKMKIDISSGEINFRALD